MWLLILEALGALALLLLLVWWTMFSGRRRGEREAPPEKTDADDSRPGPG
jgi:hypothetical protein